MSREIFDLGKYGKNGAQKSCGRRNADAAVGAEHMVMREKGAGESPRTSGR